MNLNRRQFLVLTAGVVSGCNSVNDDSNPPGVETERVINAGQATAYANDGVYSGFRDQGFFVVRDGEKLFALSAFCTHRKCKLQPEADRSFYCKCHGSTFDPSGHVTKPPAKRDLPELVTSVTGSGDLMVQVPAW